MKFFCFTLIFVFFHGYALAQQRIPQPIVVEESVRSNIPQRDLDDIYRRTAHLGLVKVERKDIKTDAVYKSLRERLEERKLTRPLASVLKVAEAGANLEQVIWQQDISAFRGKLIGKLHIQRLDIFGPEINDTLRTSDGFVVNTANKFHISTRKRVIRNQLLFSEGDLVSLRDIRESERLLRSLPYIMDARIYVYEHEDESVEVHVVVKDVWSFTADFQPRRLNVMSLRLAERNIFGTGHTFSNTFLWNSRESQEFNYDGFYFIPNIGGTFISGNIRYANSYNASGFEVGLERQFVSPLIKYAGGAFFSEMRERRVWYDTRDSLLSLLNVSSQVRDVWLARAYEVGKNDNGVQSRLVVSGRVIYENFLQRPMVNADSNRSFHDHTTYLASIGFSKRAFYQDQLIYNYGRTEDIPIGSSFVLTGGVEQSEFNRRYYTGLNVRGGRRLQGFGYWFQEMAIGGFLNNNQYEQSTLQLNSLFISDIAWVRRYQLRQFVRFSFTRGLRRYPEEFLRFTRRDGIRGVLNDQLIGHDKLFINYETIAFTPYMPLGFRMACFVFADIGYIDFGNLNVFSSPPYQGYGLGLRLRNDRLAFNALQIRFAYYPRLPPGMAPFALDVTGNSTIRFQDFDINAPEIIPLQ